MINQDVLSVKKIITKNKGEIAAINYTDFYNMLNLELKEKVHKKYMSCNPRDIYLDRDTFLKLTAGIKGIGIVKKKVLREFNIVENEIKFAKLGVKTFERIEVKAKDINKIYVFVKGKTFRYSMSSEINKGESIQFESEWFKNPEEVISILNKQHPKRVKNCISLIEEYGEVINEVIYKALCYGEV